MSQIPPLIDEIFQGLKIEITWLHGRWIIYRQLFSHSEKRIELLNECASTFFYIIQDILLGEIQVTLSKLTDPATSGQFKNLSLEQLQLRVETQQELSLSGVLRQLLGDLHIKCQPFRSWRNKRLAHLDLITIMKSKLNPLPSISDEMIEEALKITRDYMNTIERHYLQSETGYEHFIMQSDGEALIAMLKFGFRYQEMEKEGKIALDEWSKGEWKDA